jgi:hypothetical protein
MKTKDEDVGVVDPRVDEYINRLLDSANGYNLNSQSKKILNYAVYLLLNRKFQHVLQSFRLALCMPADGLRNEEEFNLWKIKFRETLNEYHNGGKIDRGVKDLIERLEIENRRPLADLRNKDGSLYTDICDDAIVGTYNYLYRYLNLTNTRNVVYWIGVIRELLLFNHPAKLLSYLSEKRRSYESQSLHFEPVINITKMIIFLYPDTTIKDIEQLIESRRNTISEEINKIKGEARKNESKTDNIKRDYFIYRTYMSRKIIRKRDDDTHFNETKADVVKNKAEESTATKGANEAKYLEVNSIRKIVDRMNKRIKNTFPNTPAELNMFLGVMAPKRRT